MKLIILSQLVFLLECGDETQRFKADVSARLEPADQSEEGAELVKARISRFMCHFNFIVLFFKEFTQMSARTEMEH